MHTDLHVYQKAMNVVTNIYTITRKFPPEERFGLTNQMRRAAVSIPSNIAEGSGRDSLKEYLHFLSIATGSTSELQTQLSIAKNLCFLNSDEFKPLDNELKSIKQMLNALKRSLKNK